jgi:voltage-gated potassium channel
MDQFRNRLFIILEAGKTEDRASVFFDGAMVVLILANVVAFSAETVPSINAEYGAALTAFNVFSVLIFTVEYVLRLWVCTDHPPLRAMSPTRARLIFACRPAMLIDLLAIAPFYLAFLISIDLRVLRIFRLVRFLKLARFSPALLTLARVFYDERRALFGALVIMLGLLMASSTAMYFVEGRVQPNAFGTVPSAMWWSLATLTTVGYGDVVPITALGKMIGGVVMIMGLGMFALPIGIVATGFIQEVHRREFVITWGMVARVPIFANLDAAAIAEIMTLMQSRVVPAGAVITREGDPAEGMYFITSGEVDVQLPSRAIVLSDGDFFGEIALIQRRPRLATAIARSNCNLLYIDADDFHALMRREPDLSKKIGDVVEERLSDNTEPEAKG